jgi:hypothetical protein
VCSVGYDWTPTNLTASSTSNLALVFVASWLKIPQLAYAISLERAGEGLDGACRL